MNIHELVQAYDADDPITSPHIYQDQSKEHHGQCHAVEVCREMIALGLTLAGWNAMEDEMQWAEIIMSASRRARLNTSASHVGFTIADALTAASYAGNYFEQGFQEVLDATAPDHVTWSKTGGVQ